MPLVPQGNAEPAKLASSVSGSLGPHNADVKTGLPGERRVLGE